VELRIGYEVFNVAYARIDGNCAKIKCVSGTVVEIKSEEKEKLAALVAWMESMPDWSTRTGSNQRRRP